jgi:two-component system, NarL family, response regulator NreC
MPIRIVLADDHVIVRHGLKLILEEEGFEVIGEASNGQEVVRLAEKLKPDVAILDVGMPLPNGIDATKEIVKVSPRTKIILLSMHSENRFVMNALRADARGYLLKERAAEDLVQAVTEVTRGGIYLSPSIAQTVVQAYLTSSELSPDPLSVRERQVLQLVAEGNTSKDVATILGISVKTAESHRNHIMDKLNIHNVAGLVRYRLRRMTRSARSVTKLKCYLLSLLRIHHPDCEHCNPRKTCGDELRNRLEELNWRMQQRTATSAAFQKLPSRQLGMKEADPNVSYRHSMLWWLNRRYERKARRVRHELEVNMREREREQLARRDAYERELERLAKKRKQG